MVMNIPALASHLHLVKSRKVVEMPEIIIADDNRILNLGLARFFTKKGYSVKSAFNGDELVNHCRDNEIEIAVVDLQMPVMSGLDAIRKIKEISPKTRIVVITGSLDWKSLKKSIQLGVMGCLLKPFTLDEIGLAIEKAIGDETSFDQWNGGPIVEAELGPLIG
jgi:two-component system, NtrC family, response regulator AtoC